MKFIYVVFSFLFFTSAAYAADSYFSVQVSTTSKYEDALYAYSKLKDNPNARIEKISNAYAVRMGAYRNRDEALPLLTKLKQNHRDAIIINCYIIENRIMQSNNLNIPGDAKGGKKPSSDVPVPDTKTPLPSPSRPTAVQTEKMIVAASKIPEPPKITAINADDFLKAGIQNHRERKYDLAIGSLSHYLSLVPKSRQRVSALLILGKSLDEMNKPRQALAVFSRIIEQFPGSPEATLSIVAMADIGLAQLGLKYPIGMKGAEYVIDPVLGYDVALLKRVPSSSIEYVYYQKGRALWKKGQYIESYQLMTQLLKEYPQTIYYNEIIGSLKGGVLTLINQYQQAGDHLSAANIFLQGRKSGAIGADDSDIILKVARSFAYLGLYEDAVKILSNLRTNLKAGSPNEIDTVLAEIETIRPADVKNLPRDREKWDLFESGRSYLMNDDLPSAEQTLTNLKNKGGEPFWSKVSDYALQEKQWVEKYLGHAEKK